MNRPGDTTDPHPKPNDVQPADHVESASNCLVAPESDYAEFGLWIDLALEKLVAQWGPSAAPAAKQAASRSKFGR